MEVRLLRVGSSSLEDLDYTKYQVILFSVILVIVIYLIYKVIVYSLPVILLIASVLFWLDAWDRDYHGYIICKSTRIRINLHV